MRINRNWNRPLANGETLDRTIGCRHAAPAGCAKMNMASVCAFVRLDGRCIRPPSSWKKLYVKLLGAEPDAA